MPASSANSSTWITKFVVFVLYVFSDRVLQEDWRLPESLGHRHQGPGSDLSAGAGACRLPTPEEGAGGQGTCRTNHHCPPSAFADCSHTYSDAFTVIKLLDHDGKKCAFGQGLKALCFSVKMSHMIWFHINP